MCGPSQLFFFQCGPGMPKGCTPPVVYQLAFSQQGSHTVGGVPVSSCLGYRAGFHAQMPTTLANPSGVCLLSSARPRWGQSQGLQRTSDREPHVQPWRVGL